MFFFLFVNMNSLFFKSIKIPPKFKVVFQRQQLQICYLDRKIILFIHNGLTIDVVNPSFLYLRYHPQILEKQRLKKRLRQYYASIFFTFKKKIEQSFFGLLIGYHKQLFLEGVGYKVENLQRINSISFKLGFSHDIRVVTPKDILVYCPKDTLIILKSFSNELLGRFSADLQKYKAPDVYKNKGILINGQPLQKKKLKKK